MEEEIQASEQVDDMREVVNEVVTALGYKSKQTDESYAALHYTISTIIGADEPHSQILGWADDIRTNSMLPGEFVDYSRDILLPKVREWRKSGVDLADKLGMYIQVLVGDETTRGLLHAAPDDRKRFIDAINL